MDWGRRRVGMTMLVVASLLFVATHLLMSSRFVLG
jgi:hypothetical protein